MRMNAILSFHGGGLYDRKKQKKRVGSEQMLNLLTVFVFIPG